MQTDPRCLNSCAEREPVGFQHRGQRHTSSDSPVCRDKPRSCRTTSTCIVSNFPSDGPAMNSGLRMEPVFTENTHLKVRTHITKWKQSAWRTRRASLPGKRLCGVSSVALYPVAQVCVSRSSTRVAAAECFTQSLTSTRKSSDLLSGQKKLSQVFEAVERMRQVQARPFRRVDPQVSVQSTLTSKEKNDSDSNQTPKSLLPT